MVGMRCLAAPAGLLLLAGCGLPAVTAQNAPVCLASYAIDHTTVANDRTILFTMRDRSVWKNTLDAPCFGLALDPRGFTYTATDPGSDTICANLVTIVTNTDHTVCGLGAFTRISTPARATAARS